MRAGFKRKPPQPRSWDGTRTLNLAPYSFFNAFNYRPPIIGFSSIGYKDSVRDIVETREFAWTLVTSPPEVSELEFARLMPAQSKLISSPRVAESPVSFECPCSQIVQLSTADGGEIQTWLVLGEVIMVHISQSLLRDGVYDASAAGHLLRGGEPSGYFMTGSEQLFRK